MPTLCQDIALLTKLPILATQAGQLLAFGARHHVRPRAILGIGALGEDGARHARDRAQRRSDPEDNSDGIAERANLRGPDVGRHAARLKHPAITWAVQTGLGLEAAAEYFDTSASTIRAHFWHHSPLHHAEGRAAVERGER